MIGEKMLQVSLDNLSRFIDAISIALEGEETIFARAESLLSCCSGSYPDTWGYLAFNVRGDSPIFIADNFPSQQMKAALVRYFRETHICNPAWIAMQNGLPDGIYRMEELAVKYSVPQIESGSIVSSKDEEIGYRTLGWPERLVEVVVVTTVDADVVATISLSRPESKGGIPKELIEVLHAFKPLIDKALISSWPSSGLIRKRPTSLNLEFPGLELLSSRESEVIQMVLRGHSNLSISMSLGIAVATVKVHRQRAYSKLRISNQQELFSLVLGTKKNFVTRSV